MEICGHPKSKTASAPAQLTRGRPQRSTLNDMVVFLVVALGVALLAGCSTPNTNPAILQTHSTEIESKQAGQDAAVNQWEKPSLPELNNKFFGVAPPFISHDAIFQLNQEQQNRFLEYFNDEHHAGLYAAERISEYLNESFIEYVDRTYTAQQTMDKFSGNCLSLAIVTTALAKLIEQQPEYHLVTTVPTYDKFSDVIFVVEHVRCTFKHRAEDYPEIPSDYDTTTTVDYFNYPKRWTGQPISEEQFIAMYYRNLAVEALADKQLSQSYWLLRKSLEFDPENGHTINTLAIVFRRKGELNTAEKLYLYGLSVADDKLQLLKNYRTLLKQQQRVAETENITKQLDKLHDPNPYNWILLAQDAIKEKSYYRAIAHYKKAIKLAPYLHDAYLGLTNVYLLTGNRQEARKTIRSLLEQAYTEEQHLRFSAKLRSI